MRAFLFMSLLIGVPAFQLVPEHEIPKDVMFVSANHAAVRSARGRAIAREWDRAEGVYTCQNAEARLSYRNTSWWQNLQNKIMGTVPRSAPKVLVHVGEYCPNLIQKFPTFAHVADPLDLDPKGEMKLDGMCGMLLPSRSKETAFAASQKYHAVKTWYAPVASFENSGDCHKKHQPETMNILLAGEGIRKFFSNEENHDQLTAWIEETTKKQQPVEVFMEWSGHRMVPVGKKAYGDESVLVDSDFSNYQLQSADEEAAQRICGMLNQVSLLVVWDECAFRKGKAMDSHESQDCQNFLPAERMANALQMGIPTVAISKIQSFRDTALDKSDLVSDLPALLARLTKLTQDQGEFQRVQKLANDHKATFAKDLVIKNYYEPMRRDALRECTFPR